MGPVQTESAGATGSGWVSRPGGATDSYLRGRQRTENFPVALRVLPRAPRTHLMAVYDVARVIDDLGDAAPGDRSELLREFRDDLSSIWAGGRPQAPVLVRLASTVAACELSRQPFLDLIEANLVDQVLTRYPAYADLVAYCALSANPIGRMVLEVFGQSTPERIALSDQICTALQIIEHCQDIAEDYRAGRVYLPVEDLATFGVSRADSVRPAGHSGPARPAGHSDPARPAGHSDPDDPDDAADLAAAPASEQVRDLLRFELDRCGDLLAAGPELIGQLRGWCRIAVAGYLAGGLAAIDGIRRADYDVISVATGTKRVDIIKHLIALLTGRKGI